MSVQRIFFFSSRRRHTRSKRDWSSDVCSSDLVSIGVVHGKPSTVVNVNLLLVLDGASFSSMSVSRIRPDRLSAVVVVDRKSTRLNSSHVSTSYAVLCLKKKKASPSGAVPVAST